jgi:hypothetical protein
MSKLTNIFLCGNTFVVCRRSPVAARASNLGWRWDGNGMGAAKMQAIIGKNAHKNVHENAAFFAPAKLA